MSTMLLVAILCFLIGMVVMIIYLIDRLNSMERKHALTVSSAYAGVDSAAPAFGNIDGAHLWEVLSGMAPLDSTAVTIDEIRTRYEPVLRRHIEELFEDGVLDGRHGVRFQPKAERTIKCSAGMLNSWIPPADARVIYDIGVERSHITTLNFSAIYPKLESVIGCMPRWASPPIGRCLDYYFQSLPPPRWPTCQPRWQPTKPYPPTRKYSVCRNPSHQKSWSLR